MQPASGICDTGLGHSCNWPRASVHIPAGPSRARKWQTALHSRSKTMTFCILFKNVDSLLFRFVQPASGTNATGLGHSCNRPQAFVIPARNQCPGANVIPARSQCSTGPELSLAPAGWRCNSGATFFRLLYRFRSVCDMHKPNFDDEIPEKKKSFF